MANSAPLIREGKWASLWECHPRGKKRGIEMEILRPQLIKVRNMLAKLNPISPQQENSSVKLTEEGGGIQKENTHCNDIFCLTLRASKLILLRGRSGLIVTWVARWKVAGGRNSLLTLCRLVAGGSAPIARYPWVRERPQIASGLCTKVWRGRLNDFSTLAMVSNILVYSLSVRRARK